MGSARRDSWPPTPRDTAVRDFFTDWSQALAFASRVESETRPRIEVKPGLGFLVAYQPWGTHE